MLASGGFGNCQAPLTCPDKLQSYFLSGFGHGRPGVRELSTMEFKRVAEDKACIAALVCQHTGGGGLQGSGVVDGTPLHGLCFSSSRFCRSICGLFILWRPGIQARDKRGGPWHTFISWSFPRDGSQPPRGPVQLWWLGISWTSCFIFLGPRI
jgi:hypothetical protein